MRWKRLLLGCVAALVLLGTGLLLPGCLAQPELPADPGWGGTRAPDQVLRLGLIGQVHSLDPALLATLAERQVAGLLYATLTTAGVGLEAVPSLASSWTVDPEGRSYTFQLAAAAFPDGSRISAADVKASWERLLSNPATSGAQALKPVAAVTPVEETTLGVALREPSRAWPLVLTQPQLGVVDQRVLAQNQEGYGTPGNYSRPALPLGSSGTWRLVEWLDGQLLVLEPSPSHGGKGLPRRLELVLEPDDEAALLDFKGERVDGIVNLHGKAYRDEAARNLSLKAAQVTVPDISPWLGSREVLNAAPWLAEMAQEEYLLVVDPDLPWQVTLKGNGQLDLSTR